MSLLSIQRGSNAEVFAKLIRFYAPPPKTILDLNMGPGLFYKKVGLDGYEIVGCDIRGLETVTAISDCRHPPFQDGSFDVVVMDPPYQHGGPRRKDKSSISDHVKQYSRVESNPHLLELFNDEKLNGVLTDDGILIIKIMDTIEWTRSQWNHILLPARLPSFYLYDIVIYRMYDSPPKRFKHQTHVRKVHAYFMIFSKQEQVGVSRPRSKPLQEVFQ